jgi:hypothetical protein
MRVMIISLRSLVIGAVIFFFVLIAGIVLLVQDPLDVSSSYMPETESVFTSSGEENHAFSSEKPSLAMDVKLEGTSAEVTLFTQNFKFVKADGSGKQVHGQGHAHLYLDGKLIYKVYDPKFIVKKLPKGEHELRVELAYSNHLPYNKVEAVKILQVK